MKFILYFRGLFTQGHNILANRFLAIIIDFHLNYRIRKLLLLLLLLFGSPRHTAVVVFLAVWTNLASFHFRRCWERKGHTTTSILQMLLLLLLEKHLVLLLLLQLLLVVLLLQLL